MLTFPRRRSHDDPPRHPWEVGHAAPEDLAMGLELQLIEAVRRRREVPEGEPVLAAQLDAEIADLLADLDALSVEGPTLRPRVA